LVDCRDTRAAPYAMAEGQVAGNLKDSEIAFLDSPLKRLSRNPLAADGLMKINSMFLKVLTRQI